MTDDDRPKVSPKMESEVTEENELLVSARNMGTATLPDGTDIDITHNGKYVIFLFDDDINERVVFPLGELAGAAAEFAGFDLDDEAP